MALFHRKAQVKPKMPTLLEKAKGTNTRKSNRTFSQQEIELVEAWLNSEISLGQFISVKGKNPYTFIALAARTIWTKRKKG